MKTRAFSCVHTPHFGQIYINVEGRMRDGCVPEDERDHLRKAIMKELEKFSNSRRGRMPKVEAYHAEDVYSGPHLDEAPDIVFILDGGRCEVDAKVGEGRLIAEGAPLTGVFACRSPSRPNPIGLTIVELEGVDGCKLKVKGLDALEGSPIVDLKPYQPRADLVIEARAPEWSRHGPPT